MINFSQSTRATQGYSCVEIVTRKPTSLIREFYDPRMFNSGGLMNWAKRGKGYEPRKALERFRFHLRPSAGEAREGRSCSKMREVRYVTQLCI